MENLSRLPKWVACAVCADVIYGGPGLYPIPRECGCRSTRVVPREDRGYVQWDKEAYGRAATIQANSAEANRVRSYALAAAERARGLGAPSEGQRDEFKMAEAEARKESEQRISAAVQAFPKEPEIEYVAEGEVLEPEHVMVRPTTIDQVFASHMKDLTKEG